MKSVAEKYAVTPKNYSFSPKMVTPKSEPRSRKFFNDHMAGWISNKNDGIKQRKEDKIKKELASVTFKPRILRKS